jgi:hypothetical protein
MAAPDLANWIWPDVDQSRQPHGVVRPNPYVLPNIARAIVGGIDVIGAGGTFGLPSSITQKGPGYSAASNASLGISLGAPATVGRSGGGVGDFTLLAVVNAAASTTPSIIWCLTTTSDVSPELYFLINAALTATATSGDIAIGDTTGTAGLTIAGVINGLPHTIIFTRVGTTLSCYVDGVLKGTATYASTFIGATSVERIAGYSGAGFGINGYGVPLLVTANYGLSPQEAIPLSLNPWEIFRPRTLALYQKAASVVVTAPRTFMLLGAGAGG